MISIFTRPASSMSSNRTRPPCSGNVSARTARQSRTGSAIDCGCRSCTISRLDEIVVERRTDRIALPAVVQQLERPLELFTVHVANFTGELGRGRREFRRGRLLDRRHQRFDLVAVAIELPGIGEVRPMHPQHLGQLGVVLEDVRFGGQLDQPLQRRRVGDDDVTDQIGHPLARRARVDEPRHQRIDRPCPFLQVHRAGQVRRGGHSSDGACVGE